MQRVKLETRMASHTMILTVDGMFIKLRAPCSLNATGPALP